MRVYDPNGPASTQCSGSGGMGGKTGLYFIDCNPDPQMTNIARCVTVRQDSGVSNHYDKTYHAVPEAGGDKQSGLKSSGVFTKEKQLESFERAKNKTLEILGDTTVAALGEIYGDFDAWLETKSEQVCREIKLPGTDAAATAAEAPAQGVEVSAEVEVTGNKTE